MNSTRSYPSRSSVWTETSSGACRLRRPRSTGSVRNGAVDPAGRPSSPYLASQTPATKATTSSRSSALPMVRIRVPPRAGRRRVPEMVPAPPLQWATMATTPVRLAETGSGFLQQVALGPLLSRFAVDQVGAEERAAALAKRSIKKDVQGRRPAAGRGRDGPDHPGGGGHGRQGRGPLLQGPPARPVRPRGPAGGRRLRLPVAGRHRPQALAGSGVKVASVATAFPSGQASLAVRLADVAEAVEAGADEIDMVINRGAFLAGRHQEVFEEIVVVKEACGQARLKVILETGELGTLDNVRRASVLAMAAGADFIKTSTGKIQPAATLPVALVMLEAIRDFHDRTGRMVGMKPAGGVRTAKQAIQHLVVVNETLGPDWLTPEWFRLGASSLLNDCLMQLAKERTGRYQSGDYFTKD